eukprot:SAG22_NODE_145_length_17656_cov_33.457367_3_plen_93_part_00
MATGDGTGDDDVKADCQILVKFYDKMGFGSFASVAKAMEIINSFQMVRHPPLPSNAAPPTGLGPTSPPPPPPPRRAAAALASIACCCLGRRR